MLTPKEVKNLKEGDEVVVETEGVVIKRGGVLYLSTDFGHETIDFYPFNNLKILRKLPRTIKIDDETFEPSFATTGSDSSIGDNLILLFR